MRTLHSGSLRASKIASSALLGQQLPEVPLRNKARHSELKYPNRDLGRFRLAVCIGAFCLTSMCSSTKESTKLGDSQLMRLLRWGMFMTP